MGDYIGCQPHSPRAKDSAASIDLRTQANTTKKNTEARQQAFLAAFSECGTILEAARAAGVGRTAVYDWQRDDRDGFRERIQHATHNFREHLEELAIARVHKHGDNANPLLLITLLNTNWPEKYRPNVAPTDDAAKEAVAEFKAALREERAKAKAERAAAAEAQQSEPRTPAEQVLAAVRKQRGNGGRRA